MRRRVPIFCLIAVLMQGAARYAAAQRSDADHWAPSIALSFDVVGQRSSAEIANGLILGAPLPEGCDGEGGELCPRSDLGQRRDVRIRPDDRGRDTMVAPLIGVSLELMSPRLGELPGEPRFFVRGDLAASAGFERNLAGEAQPGRFAEPAFRVAGTRMPEITIQGQGSRATAQLAAIQGSMGVGLAFEHDWLDRVLRFKPSLEYWYEPVRLRGVVHRAVALGTDTFTLDRFRFVQLRASKDRSYHGVGLGLELEVDSMRLGPVQTVVFAAARAYRFVGPIVTHLDARNTARETTRWRFEQDPWMWRGLAGVRFRLVWR